MKLKAHSGLFGVLGPCGYWVFGGLREMNEECEDRRRIPDSHPAPAPGRGETPTILNPDWKLGHYETNNHQFLVLITRCWVKVFNDRLRAVGINAKATYTGYRSPKEYNFKHDKADFTLTLTKAEVKRLGSLCLADGRFRPHLLDLYSSRDGFWSFLTNSVGVFMENAQGKRGKQEYERAIWQSINFVMFPDEQASRAWNECFIESVYDMDFLDTLYFVENREEAVVCER
jgi:hypothetical protein